MVEMAHTHAERALSRLSTSPLAPAARSRDEVTHHLFAARAHIAPIVAQQIGAAGAVPAGLRALPDAAAALRAAEYLIDPAAPKAHPSPTQARAHALHAVEVLGRALERLGQ
jgi:hypothetical protein